MRRKENSMYLRGVSNKNAWHMHTNACFRMKNPFSQQFQNGCGIVIPNLSVIFFSWKQKQSHSHFSNSLMNLISSKKKLNKIMVFCNEQRESINTNHNCLRHIHGKPQGKRKRQLMVYWMDQTLFVLNVLSQGHFLLMLLSASDRSFNLGVADKPLICHQTFSYLPQYCALKVCLEMKPNSMFPLQMVDLFQLVAALLI